MAQADYGISKQYCVYIYRLDVSQYDRYTSDDLDNTNGELIIYFKVCKPIATVNDFCIN